MSARFVDECRSCKRRKIDPARYLDFDATAMSVPRSEIPMTDVKNNSNDSILDLMDRAQLARETGGLTDAECVELNALANRLKFAADFNQPLFVLDCERVRFAFLKARSHPGQGPIFRGIRATSGLKCHSFIELNKS